MTQMRTLRPFPNLATREPFLTNVFDVYHQMFKKEYCCDTLLISKEYVRFHVHHFILIGCSGFFRNHLIQNSTVRFNMAFKFDISENILRHIVEFMYTGLLDTFFKDEKIDFALVHSAAVTMGISALAKYCLEIQEGCMTIGPLGDTNKPTATQNIQRTLSYKLPIQILRHEKKISRKRGRPRSGKDAGGNKRGRPRKDKGSETGADAEVQDMNLEEDTTHSKSLQSEVHSDPGRTVLSKSVQDKNVCNSVGLEISEEEKECRRWIVEQANSEDTLCRLIKTEPQSPTEPHTEDSKNESEISEGRCHYMPEDGTALDARDIIKEEPKEEDSVLKVSRESLVSNNEDSKNESERSGTSGDPYLNMHGDRMALDAKEIKEEPKERDNFLKIVSCESLASNNEYRENVTKEQWNGDTGHVSEDHLGSTVQKVSADSDSDKQTTDNQPVGGQVNAVMAVGDLRIWNNRVQFWKKVPELQSQMSAESTSLSNTSIPAKQSLMPVRQSISKTQMPPSQSISNSQPPCSQSVLKSKTTGRQSGSMNQMPASQPTCAGAKASHAGKKQPLSIAPRPPPIAKLGGVPVSSAYVSCPVRNQPPVPSSAGKTVVSTASLQPQTIVTGTQLGHTVVVPAGHLQSGTVLKTNQLQQGTMLPIQLQAGQILTASNLPVGTVIPTPAWQAATPVGTAKPLQNSIIAAQLQTLPQVQSPAILPASPLQQGTVAVLQQPNIQLATTRPELLNQNVLNYTVSPQTVVTVTQSQSTVSHTTSHSPVKKLKLEDTAKSRIGISKLSLSISEMSNVIEKLTSPDQDTEADLTGTADKSMLGGSEESQGNATISPQPSKEVEKPAKKPPINASQGTSMRRQRAVGFGHFSGTKPTIVVAKSLVPSQGVYVRKLDVCASSASEATQSSKGSLPIKHKHKSSYNETGSQDGNSESGEIIEILPRVSETATTTGAENPQTSAVASVSTSTLQYTSSATTNKAGPPPILPVQRGLVFTLNHDGTITPSYSGDLQPPVLIDQDKVRPLAWKCTLCQCRFQKWMHLQCHMAETHSHKQQSPQECCGLQFHSRFHYMLHRQQKVKSSPFITHQRLFVCPKFVCEFNCRSARSWQEHLMTHLEEADQMFHGKNCCGICGIAMDTSNRTTVRRHSLVHMYDNPFESSWVNIAYTWCKFCRNYIKGTNIMLHMKEVHNVWSTEATSACQEDTSTCRDTQHTSGRASPDGSMKDSIIKNTEEKTSDPTTAQVLSKFKLILPKTSRSRHPKGTLMKAL